MNETEFQAFLNNLETLKPTQFERVFELLHGHFLHHNRLDVAWRCKQAHRLLKEKIEKKASS
jgi:hypothetical protein